MGNTIHIVSLWHTLVDNAHSACAFTGKILRFPECVRPHGWRVVEYGAPGSESLADEHIEVISTERREELLAEAGGETGAFNQRTDGALWKEMHAGYMRELPVRAEPGDIVAHPFGSHHAELMGITRRGVFHVETGIGYTAGPFGAWRIFESEAWRHWHWGKWGGGPHEGRHEFPPSPNYSWVIPNYYRLDEWPEGDGSGDYVLFAGRLIIEKGLNTIREIIKARPDLRYVFAGGPPEAWDWYKGTLPADAKVEYLGVVKGTDRARVYGQARCMLMPTEFIEPFGGSGVEAQLCGTPLIASDFGAFTETTPLRAKTLQDWLDAIEDAPACDRADVRACAQIQYGTERAGVLYDRAFRQIQNLAGDGWHTLRT